ncbi:MAG: T9SS type A sorting domain-containing protein [Saprospiraceae bacterium]|nr:T9SS type A sorting domain-containing protein [Saprospiraceae bacterium]
MKRLLLSRIDFLKYWKDISLILLLITGFNIKSEAQACATLTGVPISVCRTNTVATYFINGFDGNNTYAFSVIGGSALVNAVPPNVSITWHTVGNVVIVMTETPPIGSCTPDTIRVRVSSTIAPQVDCNDTTNVSLDENCLGVVTPDMVIEGSGWNPLDYDIIIRDAFTKIPIATSPTVNSSHVGQFLEVAAVHRCSGNYCWGVLRVEDKLKPRLLCRTLTVNCGVPILPSSPGIGFPKPTPAAPNPVAVPGVPRTYTTTSSAYDNCGSTTISYSDRTINVVCPPPAVYIDTVFRDWTATDGYGNVTQCTDTILVRAGSIDSITCPPNYDDIDEDALRCDANFQRDAAGNPHPNVTGYPGGVGCRNINYSYNDVRLNICVGSYKILREWLIIDWCTGRDTECVQLIKILDTRGPIITCRSRDTVSTIGSACSGNATIGLPTILTECSYPLSYDVLVKRGVADPSIPVTSIDAVRDGVVRNNTNPVTYTISDLPVGWSWVIFRVTDACGNTEECSTEILVQEKTKPIPVCHLETVVALTTGGWARVYAESFDDGSYDNCALDSILVRRMDTSVCGGSGNKEFAPYIDFCCDDIRKSPITVIMRVKDKAGNINECMVNAIVQDKRPPIVNCLPNITVSCTFDYSNLEVFGNYQRNESDRRNIIINDPGNTSVAQPRNWGKDGLITEDCILDTTYRYVLPPANGCGTGNIFRIWTFADGNNTVTCTQKISIVNFTPYNGSTIVPARDTTFIGCLNSTDPSVTGRPSWPNNLNCSRLVAGYSDQVFNQVENACYKILRRWTIIDDCNPNFSWGRTQVIKVANNQGPVFPPGFCFNKTFDILSDNCTGFIELIGIAGDDCTDTADLAWSYKIDLNNNGSIDATGVGNNASGVYAGGTHRITWTVEDRCGNSSTCTYTFVGRDRKAPTPYCRGGIVTVIMPSSGNVDVWASDLNLASTDNCSPSNALRYSFSTNTSNTSRRYNCDSLPNGVSKTFDVRIYVTDEAGNQNYCDTRIIIQDGLGNACQDHFGGGGNNTTALVSGVIQTGTKKSLEEAMVSISGNMSSLPKYHLTQVDGKFAFPDIPLAENYLVKAEKNDDYLNGVSTADIVLIQRHILGISSLNDPYQIIASDVNDSRTITSKDISDIRKLILGVNNEFPSKKSWKFINANQKFNDVNTPWPLDESINIVQLSGDIGNNNMIAIKLGDVSGNARTSNAQGVISRTNQIKLIHVPDLTFEAKDLLNIPVYLSENVSLSGLQFQMEFDPMILRFETIKSGLCDINANNINLSLVEKGIIRLSWDNPQGRSSNDALFTIELSAIKKGSLSENLALSHEEFNNEIYFGNNDLAELRLSFRNSDDKINNGFYLYQNQPNPFSLTTTISFVLPQEEMASLKIYDVNGRLLKEISRTFKAGFNSVQLNKNEFEYGGILYYNLETSKNRASRKMIMIE